MSVLRSLAFNIVIFIWTVGWLAFLWVILPFPSRVMRAAVVIWGRGVMTAMRWVIGLEYEVRGLQNLPEGPVIIASKHQSAWDTIVFCLLSSDPVYILKKELLLIPLWGWYVRKAGNIPVDRTAGTKALKGMVSDVAAALAKGLQVVIFPEGSRTAPGERRPYNPGIAAIYAHTKAPVTPVALNSGLFWGRRSFIKKPGRIVVEILPPISGGLRPRVFLAELEQKIEDASERLITEATSGASHRSTL